MYEAFYGLRERPFNLTPDPRYLYLSEKHREAFAHLMFGIKNRTGFVMISGEVGTGKTTICRSLLNQLDDDTELAFIFNPALSPKELLRKINEDFGIASRGQTAKDLVDELNAYLLNRKAEGKNCVLVIDEAQNLEPSVLEQLRLLSNLETEREKLLQIVLIGQPELARNLRLPELRQLNQRITARYHLKPLDLGETTQYIAYRLRVAGGLRKVQFTRGAVRAVYRLSAGTPRLINALCDRALLIGYTREVRQITKDVVRHAAKEIRGDRAAPKRRLPWRRFLPSPSIVTTAALILVIIKFAPYLWDTPRHETVTASIPAPDPGIIAAENLEKVLARIGESQASPASAASVRQAEERRKTPGLGETLSRLEADAARNAAAVGILRAWNLALVSDFPQDDAVESLAAFGEANGLAHEAFTPTLEQLAAINLPAFVKVAADDKSLWLGLVGMERNKVRLTTGFGETILVSKDEFTARYLDQAVVLWRDPTPEAGVLAMPYSGAEVRELQEALSVLGKFRKEPTGHYDEDTLAAVAGIQSATGLVVDGKVGRQTRMVLTSWLPETPTPALQPSVLRPVWRPRPPSLPSDLSNEADEAVLSAPQPSDGEYVSAVPEGLTPELGPPKDTDAPDLSGKMPLEEGLDAEAPPDDTPNVAMEASPSLPEFETLDHRFTERPEMRDSLSVSPQPPRSVRVDDLDPVVPDNDFVSLGEEDKRLVTPPSVANSPLMPKEISDAENTESL